MFAPTLRLRFTAALCLGIATLGAPPAAATIYYVRKTGSNSNNGPTPAAAWLTINKAATTMVAGDTAYVGAGTYVESVVPSNDGTATAPVRLESDMSGAFTGDAGDVLIGGGGARPYDNARAYQQLVGFKIFNGSTGVRFRTRSGGRLENCEIYSHTTMGVDVDTANTTLINCSIHNISGIGLRFQGSCTVGVDRCASYSNTSDGFAGVTATTTATFTRCRSYANNGRGFDLQRGVYNLQNCLIYNNSTSGIHIRTGTPTAVFWNTTISGSGANGVLIDNGSVTLTNCAVAFSATSGLRRNGTSTMTHTYNIVSGSTGANFNGVTQSTGELTSDPLFVNRPANDYHLSGGSPAINAGASAAGIVDVDLDNNRRPQGVNWDIGAYEANSGGSSTGVHITGWVEVP